VPEMLLAVISTMPMSRKVPLHFAVNYEMIPEREAWLFSSFLGLSQ
jgi:hypothetical protein